MFASIGVHHKNRKTIWEGLKQKQYVQGKAHKDFGKTNTLSERPKIIDENRFCDNIFW